MEKEKGWDKNDGTFLVLRRKTGLTNRSLGDIKVIISRLHHLTPDRDEKKGGIRLKMK